MTLNVVLGSRVRETTTTTGDGGNFLLLGTSTGFQRFADAIGDNVLTFYAVVHRDADEWEVGIGRAYDNGGIGFDVLQGGGSEVTGTVVLDSSNGGAAVDFSAGTKDIFVDIPAEKLIYVDGNGDAAIANELEVGGVLKTNAGVVSTVTTITSTTSLGASHHVVLCDNSSDIDADLPAASVALGQVYVIKKVSASADTVTIDPDGSETIDGQTSLVLYLPGDAVSVQSDGAAWHLIADNRIAHAASMHRSTAQAIGTGTTVSLNVADFDVGGIADPTTNNRFVVRRAGRYLVQASLGWNSGLSSGSSIGAYISVNGTEVQNQFSVVGALLVSAVNVSQLLNLASGDLITMRGFQNSGSLNSSTVERYRPRMSVHEIR